MKRSLNETGTMLRKACVGAGLPVGLAEDLGRAGTWLIAHGHDGASAVLTALAGDLSSPAHLQTNAAQAIFSNTAVAVCGPSAIDLAIADAKAEGVLLNNADSPLLVIGLAGAAAVHSDHKFTVGFSNGCSAIVTAIGVSLNSQVPATACDVEISSRRTQSGIDVAGPAINDFVISDDDWQKITRLATKTYVPATEASREKGAGAGMIDND